MTERADVIIMGVGTAGEDLSLRLAHAGLDVVGIEPNLVGGECPFWACIPSKFMIRASNLLAEARRVDGVAGHVEVAPDWPLVASRLRAEVTGGWDDSFGVERFRDAGGRFVRGYGRLTGPNSVAVGDREFTADRGIVIATGSHPVVPPIPGLDTVEYWTTHDAIEVESLPASLLVLGGGTVGCELSQVFARFGVDVTVIEGADRILAGEDPVASEVIKSVFEAEGINVHTGAHVTGFEARDGGVVAMLDDGAELTAERLLVAAGRFVDLSALGLETVGVDSSARFIDVDDHLRVADKIWALGDITGKGMLTSVAVYQGSIVGADILGQNPPPADYRALPRITFTDPEVGSVGLTEAAARDAGLDVDVVTKSVPATFRGWIHGPGAQGVIKLVVDRSGGVIVGAISVGPYGGEVLGMLATAVHARVPVESLAHMIYGYPTFFGGIGEAIGAYARGIVKVLDPDADPLFKD
jgi:pyruvate/2-oxoglutarate dehydrogenase complex dihydrolipoamide dehydrogenase (E3) component